MSIAENLDLVTLGRDLHAFAAELYPICRSITGDGLRQTLAAIGGRIPLQTFEVPSGTSVCDWTVPKEWNIRDAYIADLNGHRIIDFKQCNLHVVQYSSPVRRRMPLSELKLRLFSIPEHPDCIPYRTSYYKEGDWGFCLSQNQLLALQDAEYEVCIDSTLENGSLSYGECYLPGSSPDEVLISSHICHPSLANDNLSGLSVAAFLAELLAKRSRRYSYRFLFLPATIGAIAWLSRNRDAAERVKHGLVLTCVGDAGGFHYKKSRRGNAVIDRAAALVLRHSAEPSEVLDFSPYGYDERQYCSPGFNLPVGCLMRSVWGTFPEYHTSADNLDFLKPDKMAGSLQTCAAIMDVLEKDQRYRNLAPYGEPQLGPRGLYASENAENLARLWVLNLSDGEHSLLDIAARSGLEFGQVWKAAMLLLEHGLLAPISPELRNS
jgi:aminopeptidase-like protein